MRFLLYAAPTNEAGLRLLKIIRSLSGQNPYRCCSTIGGLTERLRQPRGTEVVAILCPSGDDDMSQLLGIRPLLRDVRVILVLPDSRTQTISEGHALRPRFVAYADGDFSDVAAVVEKVTRLASPPAGGFGEQWVCSEVC